MKLSDDLLSLALSFDKANCISVFKKLNYLKCHSNSEIRQDVTKTVIKFITLGLKTTFPFALEWLRNPQFEKCCCIKRLKTIALSELVKNAKGSAKNEAIYELLKLRSDTNNFIRFTVASTFSNISRQFIYPYTKDHIMDDLSILRFDLNQMVSEEAKSACLNISNQELFHNPSEGLPMYSLN
jgi:hypothetical protein